MSLRAENSRYLKFEFSKINEFGSAKCFDFLLLKQNQHQKRIFMHKNNVSQVFLMQEKQHTSIKITNLPNCPALTKKSLRAEKNFKRNSTTMLVTNTIFILRNVLNKSYFVESIDSYIFLICKSFN